MNDTVKMWLGIVGTAVVVFILVSPQMATGDTIRALGSFQIGAIEALQGRSSGRSAPDYTGRK